MPTGRAAKPIADRIHESVKITPDGCWEWTKSRLYGYGQMFVGSWTDNSRRTQRAHRVSYETFIGPIPEGFQIDHLCNNRACVNPEHLEPVSPRLNSVRRSSRMRGVEVCPKGHAQNEDTTYQEGGVTRCRPCDRKWAWNG